MLKREVMATEKLHQMGVRVYLQQTNDQSSVDWSNVRDKVLSNI